MKIVTVGGGPGGLYAAILLKKSDPSRDVVVIDRNPAGSTYGWGVVFSDETLGFLESADPESHSAIIKRFVHWEAIDIYFRGEQIRSGGHAFSGVARRTLLDILQQRCRKLGVRLELERENDVRRPFPDADLVIAADGVNSRLRELHAAHFKTTFDVHGTRYIWLGMELTVDAFTFVFQATEWGLFQVHAYPFDVGLSTCIVECTEQTWRRAGLDRADERQSIAFCQDVFADFLQGSRLISNRATWMNFVTVRNEHWYDGNLVLLGDAAHTAHFSIGSGTKIAMEDAIALAEACDHAEQLGDALTEYEALRQPVVERTQQAARDSSLWFEHVERYADFEPTQFAFSLLTRSKRITYQTLRVRDPAFGKRVDAWYAREDGMPVATLPDCAPVDAPLCLRARVLPNRRVALVRGCDDAVDGHADERFVREVVAHAQDGAALIMIESLAVTAEGRVTIGSTGLYQPGREQVWQRLTDTIHASGSSLIGAQLTHAGARGATQRRSIGIDLPLSAKLWPLSAASSIAYSPYSQIPRCLDQSGMDQLIRAFVVAAGRAAAAGFDLLELNFGHGYLPASFLSPLTNQRSDEHGGSLPNRAHFPLAILSAVREAWPPDLPLSVSFSASDWSPHGIAFMDALDLARWFHAAGADLIHVVSGQTTFRANPPYGRSWEAPLADAIRNAAQVPTLVGGQINDLDEANTLLAAGRSDLVVLAEPTERNRNHPS